MSSNHLSFCLIAYKQQDDFSDGSYIRVVVVSPALWFLFWAMNLRIGNEVDEKMNVPIGRNLDELPK